MITPKSLLIYVLQYSVFKCWSSSGTAAFPWAISYSPVALITSIVKGSHRYVFSPRPHAQRHMQYRHLANPRAQTEFIIFLLNQPSLVFLLSVYHTSTNQAVQFRNLPPPHQIYPWGSPAFLHLRRYYISLVNVIWLEPSFPNLCSGSLCKLLLVQDVWRFVRAINIFLHQFATRWDVITKASLPPDSATYCKHLFARKHKNCHTICPTYWYFWHFENYPAWKVP